ncbi:ABC transporter substrate-binding protein [Halobacteriovorax sp. HLS]|uniref:substrate-binding periplasmic protein n=1 Tax=Halobacteriovorax sp. HLS TaxID=2234000 RepID=UPI000FD71DE8|nr:transporter substrate-binding domain-containing protein [Halobacteriovorax sp. HLS]
MKKITLVIFFFCSILPSFSKEKLVLGTFIIPRYIQSSTKGEFIELTKEISKLSNMDIEIKILPPKRTLLAFTQNEIDGYFPALDALQHGKVNKTSDFYIKEDFIFERKLSSYKKLKTKVRVCLTRGYPYHRKVLNNKDWVISYASSDENCIELVNLNRADIFIGEEITGLAAIKNLNLSNKITYNKFTPISEQSVYFAFPDNEVGKKRSAAFDKALKKIIMSGKYNKLFHLKEKK